MKEFIKVAAATLCIIIMLVTLLFKMLATQYGSTVFEIPTGKGRNDMLKPSNDRCDGSLSPGEPTTAVKVILITLYRGGSSFLGETFKQNPRAFYYYEPLGPIFWKEHLMESSSTMNKKTVPEDIVDRSVREIADLLNCRLSNISRTDFRQCSNALRSWGDCMKSVNKSLGIGGATLSERECLDAATDTCRRSEVVAAKTIRLQMYMVRKLLDIDPDIKVVLYVRDPRGNIRSRRMGRGFDESPKGLAVLKQVAEGLCSRISRDLVVYRELKSTKKNIWLMKYEMLAKDSAEFIEKEYKLLGTELPNSVLDYFNRSTRATKAGGLYSTLRTNSTLTAEKWRMDMPTKSQRLITNICGSVLKELNYE